MDPQEQFQAFCATLPADATVSYRIMRQAFDFAWQAARNDMHRLIASDGYAMTFQSMGQYRKALLAALSGQNKGV